MADVFPKRRWFPWDDQSRSPVLDDESLNLVMIHEAYADYVFRMLQRLWVRPQDLEDLMQEVFLVVHRKLHTFDRSKSMEAWICGICKNVAAQHWRQVSRLPVTIELGDEVCSDEMTAEELMVSAQYHKQLRELLHQIDEDKRIVLVMFEIEEMSCEDIATELGLKVGTVFSRLHKARKELQKAFERYLARRRRGEGR